MTKNLRKHKHQLVLTKTKPEVLLIMARMGCDFHIHEKDKDLNIYLAGTLHIKVGRFLID